MTAGVGYTLWHLWRDPSLADIPTDISVGALGLAVLALLFCLSLSPWLARRSPAWIVAAGARMLGIGLLYGGWH